MVAEINSMMILVNNQDETKKYILDQCRIAKDTNKWINEWMINDDNDQYTLGQCRIFNDMPNWQ